MPILSRRRRRCANEASAAALERRLAALAREIEIREAQLSAALLENARYRRQTIAFLQHLRLPCIVTDAAGVMREVSEGAASVLGDPVRSLSGRPLSAFLELESRQAWFHLLARAQTADAAVSVVETLGTKSPSGRAWCRLDRVHSDASTREVVWLLQHVAWRAAASPAN